MRTGDLFLGHGVGSYFHGHPAGWPRKRAEAQTMTRVSMRCRPLGLHTPRRGFVKPPARGLKYDQQIINSLHEWDDTQSTTKNALPTAKITNKNQNDQE